jgi:hypothetical protein
MTRMFGDPYRKPEFGEAVIKLIGHAIGGAILFAALALLSWALGWAVATLHAVHPFNDTVLRLLHSTEVGILYLDIGLSAIVLLVGAYRFVKEISGVHP